jgi:four helix bundle protein
MPSEDPLRVLEAARLYGEQCVRIAHDLPRHAPAGLRRQLAEAAQSVSDLLAEGLGRGTVADKIRYSVMSKGELEESQNQLRRCIRLRLIERKVFYKPWNLSVVINRMLEGLLAHLRAEQRTTPKTPTPSRPL